MKVFNCIPRKRIFIDVALSMTWSFFNALFADWLALNVVSVTDSNDLLTAVIQFGILILVWEFCEFIADVYSEYTLAVIEANVSQHYLREFYYIKPEVLKSYNTGYVSGVLNKVISRQTEAYSCTAVQLPLCIVYVGYFTVRMWEQDWTFGLALLACTIISNVYRVALRILALGVAGQVSKTEGSRNKFVIDAVANIGTVQKMRSIDYMCNRLQEENNIVLGVARKWAILNEIAYCGCKLICFLYTPIALFIAYKLQFTDPTFLSLLSVVSIQFVHNSKGIARTWNKYDIFLGSYKNLMSIVSESNIRRKSFNGDFKSLRIRDFIYSYKTQDNTSVKICIPEFTFDKGDKVCIYGESGQGKTTLLHLLSGEIETDSVHINKKLTPDRLRCTFIAQDTEMFDMSLRDNLALGADIPDEVLRKHLDDVGLGEWLSKQQDGLDTLLGERGVFVSTGQRQRLNLIRGLLRKQDEVYLLDEPTSNVDEETEAKMIDLIQMTLWDKTVVIVTHRPKLKDMCNVVYKFENNTIFREK